MNPTAYQERKIVVDGWPLNVTSYQLGEQFYCKVDNVSPGAWLTRTTGTTREEAEQKAIEKARQYLARTRRMST